MVADLFHFGHVQFLKQAKSHGDYLIVGLTADEDVARYKRTPIMNVQERAQSVSGCKYVDEVIPNCPYCVTQEFIEQHNIDLVIHGDDMKQADLDYFYAVPISMGIFKTVPYTETISTTDLLTRIFDRGQVNLLKK
jgi:cytidyltransferase-like protein